MSIFRTDLALSYLKLVKFSGYEINLTVSNDIMLPTSYMLFNLWNEQVVR